MGQYEDHGGIIHSREVWRDREYQGGRNHNDRKVSGGMCPGITMIVKDVSQNGVDIPNNRGGNCPLYTFLATPFICCYGFIIHK